MSYTNRGYRAYHNFPNPLKKYGNEKVWYDRDAGIDNLSELARILGLKSITIIPLGYNNPSVQSTSGRPSPNYILILYFCNLSFEIDEKFEGIQVKYFQHKAGETETIEKRVFYKQGEEHIINSTWYIAETTQISFVKDAYKKSVYEDEVETKTEICDIIGCARMYEPEDSDTWQYKKSPAQIKTISNNDETAHNKPFNTTNPDFTFYAIPNFLINDKPLAAYGLIQTQIPYTGDADSKGYYKWNNNVFYSNQMSLKEKMENWNYTYVPVPLFDNLVQPYSPKKSYKTRNCFEDKNFGTWLIIESNNTGNDVKCVPKSQLISLYEAEENLMVVKSEINISNQSYLVKTRDADTVDSGYIIEYKNNNFISQWVTDTYDIALTGDLIRYEYIFSTDNAKEALRFKKKWGKEVGFDINDYIFSQTGWEIYGIGVRENRPSVVKFNATMDQRFNYIQLDYAGSENIGSFNHYWNYPKGLNNAKIEAENNWAYYYSSPLAWRGKEITWDTNEVSTLFNLNKNEALWSNFIKDEHYTGSLIIGQSIFFKVPMYEWLFSVDKKKYNNDYFEKSGERYESGKLIRDEDEDKTTCYPLKTNYIFFTPETDITKETKPNFKSDSDVYSETGTNGMQFDGNEVKSKEFSSHETNLDTITAKGFYTTINENEFPFPYKNIANPEILKVLQISPGNFIELDEQKYKVSFNKEWIKSRGTTFSSVLTWNGKPYYQIVDSSDDLGNPDIERSYNVKYGISISDSIKNLAVQNWTKIVGQVPYNNKGWTSLDFSLNLPYRTTAPKRSALLGLMKEPVWFEFNINTRHYDLKSIYSDIIYELPIFIDLSINFYVPSYMTTDVIKDFTLEFSSKEKEYDVKINNRLVGYLKTANESMTFLDVNKVDVGFETYCSLYSYVDTVLYTGGQSIDTPQGHCNEAIKLTVLDDISGIFGSIKDKQVSSVLKPGYTGQTTIYIDTWSEGDRAWQGCVYLQKINDIWYLYGWEWNDDGAYSIDNEWTDWNISGLYVRTYGQLT